MLDDDILKKYELNLNTRYGFLSCDVNTCGFALTDHFEHHLKNHRKKISPEDIQYIRNLRANYVTNEIQFGSDPIQGLLLIKGYECLGCDDKPFLSTTQNGLKTHQSSHSFYCGSNLVYFQTFDRSKRIKVWILFKTLNDIALIYVYLFLISIFLYSGFPSRTNTRQ